MVWLFSPRHQGPCAAVILHVNCLWREICAWERMVRPFASFQPLGCLQLVRKKYQVVFAEPWQHFNIYRKPFPHDLKLLKQALSWLGKDGILPWVVILFSIGSRY